MSSEALPIVRELIEAMQKIANHDSGVSDNRMECGNCHDEFLEPYCEVKSIARAALAKVHQS